MYYKVELLWPLRLHRGSFPFVITGLVGRRVLVVPTRLFLRVHLCAAARFFSAKPLSEVPRHPISPSSQLPSRL